MLTLAATDLFVTGCYVAWKISEALNWIGNVIVGRSR